MRRNATPPRTTFRHVFNFILAAALTLVTFSPATATGGSFNYSITYVAGIGSGTMSNQSGNAAAVSLNGNSFTPPTGEHFTSWQGSNSISYSDGQSIPLSADLTLTLTAQYVLDANAHTVTFNANGGSGTTSSETGSSSQPLTTNGFTNGALYFVGWNTVADGSGTTYFDGVNYDFSLGDLTLYAQWGSTQNVTVTFQDISSDSFITSGANPPPSSLVLGSTYVVPGNTGGLVAQGGVFAGWLAYTPACLNYKLTSACHNYPYTPGQTITVNESLIFTSNWFENADVYYSGNSSDGGTAPGVESSFNPQPVSVEGNTFTKTGFHFVGWNTHPDGSGTAYSMGDKITLANTSYPLYAQWSPDAGTNFATVTFDANGGVGSINPEINNVSNALSINSFTKVGSVFAGWNTSPSGTGSSYFDGQSYDFVASATLYAQWNAIHTVTFDANGGSGITAPETGSTFQQLTSNGFTNGALYFAGWNTAADGSGVTYGQNGYYPFNTDATLYALWSAPFTIKFDSNGGSGTMADQLGIGQNQLEANSFANAGSVFLYWSSTPSGSGGNSFGDQNYADFNQNLTLYAQWATSLPNLSFDSNGGTGSMNSIPMTYPLNFSVNTFTNAGKTFNYWTTNADGSGLRIDDGGDPLYFSSDTTLYAQWYVTAPVVTFDPNGGAGTMSPQTFTQPNSVSSNSFTRIGYTFNGWNTQPDATGFSVCNGCGLYTNNDETLYAQWTPLPHTVTFDPNGGMGTMAPETGSNFQPLTTNGFTNGALFFAGWNTTPNGSGQPFNQNGYYSFNSDTTLYAQWSTPFTFSFNSNGGSGTMADQLGAGQTQLNANTFTNSGKIFLYWSATPNGVGAPSFGDQDPNAYFNQNLTLYAQWATALPTLSFDGNGGTGSYGPIPMPYPLGGIGPNPFSAFTYPGHILNYFSSNKDGTGSYNASLSSANQAFFATDQTLYAQWYVNPPVITFDPNGGTGSISPETFAQPNSLTPNSFTRVGYTFNSWNTKVDGTGTYICNNCWTFVNSDETLYAQWTSLPHTVTFDPNGGTGTMAPETGSNPQSLTTNGFTNGALFFAGWNTAADGTGTTYLAGENYDFSGSDTTLYAQWSPVQIFTITFAPLYPGSFITSGSTPPSSSVAAGSTYIIPGNTGGLIGTGGVFSSWFALTPACYVSNLDPGCHNYSYAPGQSITVSESLILYSSWTPNANISYFGNTSDGGTTPQPQSTFDVQPITVASNTLTKTGFHFTGWNTSADGSGTPYSPGDSIALSTTNYNLYAQWSPDAGTTFATVTFNANGGTGTVNPQINNVNTPLLQNSFSRSGFTFLGWNTAPDGSGFSYGNGQNYNFSADLTLYAQWNPIQTPHTVTFDPNGGMGTMAPETGSNFQPLTTNGFTNGALFFAGWNTTPNGSGQPFNQNGYYSFNSDTTLYAQWSTPFTFSFNSNGGSGTMADQLGAGQTQLNANTFTNSGKIFLYWSATPNGVGAPSFGDQDPNAYFNQNLTLYAQWATALPTLSFDGNGGTGSYGPIPMPYPLGGIGPNPFSAFTYPGHILNYFSSNKDGTGSYNASLSSANQAFFATDQTLYAQWYVNPPVITFDPNGGTGSISPETFAQPNSLTPNSFTRVGYTFNSWNTKVDGTGTYICNNCWTFVNSDETLYAQWTSLPHTVTFDPNGGTGTMAPETGSNPQSLTTNGFTNGALFFAGWNTAADGTGTTYLAGENYDFSGSDTTLYAQWSPVQIFTITFAPLYPGSFITSGSTPPSSSVAAGSTYIIPGNTGGLIGTGGVFSSWFALTPACYVSNLDPGCHNYSYAPGQSITVSESLILYSSWTPNANISYFGNTSDGGTTPQPQSTFDVQPITVASNTLTKTGFHFTGWNTSADGSGTPYSPGDSIALSTTNYNLYAQWSPDAGTTFATVTFDPNGGAGTMAPETANSPTPLTTNNFTYAGHTFMTQWNTAPDGSGTYFNDSQAYSFNTDITLYAQWTYTVSFDSNGGSGGMNPEIGGWPYYLTENSFSRNGYNFTGWNTAADGTGKAFADKDFAYLAGDATLFAQWTAVQPAAPALTPTFGTPTATADGYTVQITNFDPHFTFLGTSSASGVVAISASGLITITGVAAGTSATATITTTRPGYADGSAPTSDSSLNGLALTPTFGTPTATADGYTVQITNFDPHFTFLGTASASGVVAISASGLITITGVAAGTSSTATITTTRPGYADGSAPFTAISISGAILNPTFAIQSLTADGFTVQITNFDPHFTFLGTASAGGVVAISATGLVTLSGIAVGTVSTITITTTRPGYDPGSATTSANSLSAPALTPNFGIPTATADGFIVQITNFDPHFTFLGTASASGVVAISVSGLVTITGVAAGAISTATITTTRPGYDDGSALVSANSLNGAALTPTFGTPTATADGFTVQITNFDPHFTFLGTASASGVVAISVSGLVTITGVAAGTSSTGTITTTRAGYGVGSAAVSGTSTTT